MPGYFRSSRRQTLAIALLVVAACWCLATLGIFALERARLRAGEKQAIVGTSPSSPFVKFAMPGILRPKTVEARASSLRDDEPVIGCLVAGKARAYRIDAFRDRSRHLVNDLLGGVPVSVAYCDISDCARAYTASEADRPLDLSVGGLYQGQQMVLDVGGNLYFQDSGAALHPGPGPASIPLQRLETTRTTWGEWKRLHPSTDAYEGGR